VKQAVKFLQPGNVMLLENLRFHKEEEEDNPQFAKQLVEATGASLFVQDAFGSVHRAHASTSAVTRELPSVAGLLLEKEVATITTAMQDPERPLVAILGGAKISDKIKVIESFVAKADQIIIGGAMANTFLRYKGLPVGESLFETDADEVIKKIYEAASEKLGTDKSVDEFILLPTDVAVAGSIDKNERRAIISVNDVQPHDHILDIGTNSIEAAKAHIRSAATVVWSGTLGYAELPQFAIGSNEVASEIAKNERMSIVGGGDTVDFVLDWDPKKGGSFTHVSTGGSASLELMSGEKLPGVENLMDK
jgi:phosphoglycerate kinase